MLVVREAGAWLAVVGIPLSAGAVQAELVVREGDGERRVPFSVRAKEYPAQHITLKNRQPGQPRPGRLARIERELAEQTAAYAVFRDAMPSNVILDRAGPGRPAVQPLRGCAAISAASRAIRTPGWTSPCRRARR